MKGFLKALAIIVLIILAVPTLFGAIGALAGFVIAAWPIVIGMAVVAIPGIIVGLIVGRKGGK